MCGVLGVVTSAARSDSVAAVERGIAVLTHRGPDAARVERLDSARARCVLGLARLRIIDLTPEADQPMSNEDGFTAIGGLSRRRLFARAGAVAGALAASPLLAACAETTRRAAIGR